jgi:formylglycine-generating enzyme required for sulfatase activity
MTIRLFCSYSHKDEDLRQRLEVHLSGLHREYPSLESWYDRLLEPGSNWDARIKAKLDAADIIVLLVSPDFLYSKYCYDIEVTRAIQRHKDGTACVIPVLLHPSDTTGEPLFQLTGYPTNLKPIATWTNQNEAFLNVVGGIRQAVKTLSAQKRSVTLPPSQNALRLQGFAFESVTVNDRGEVIGHHPGEAQQWVEPLGKGVVLEMVSIPGGSFLMGSPRDEEGRGNSESPQHRVAIAPFLIGKYPVTQSQYQAVMGHNPSHFQEDGMHRPVERVSWEDAIAFCEKLTQQTQRPYRLPSEAEWEYACRAGTTTPFHLGATVTTNLANYRGTDWDLGGTVYSGSYANAPKGEFREKTTPVGSFPPNAFGLFDMHGNVWEWCADHWHDHYQGAPTDGSAWTTGGNNNRRLLRGGSWNYDPRYCRSAVRNFSFSPVNRIFNIGFRVVCFAARTL